MSIFFKKKTIFSKDKNIETRDLRSKKELKTTSTQYTKIKEKTKDTIKTQLILKTSSCVM